MTVMFKKAERKKAKLRLGLTGPSGAGKTWAALQVAKGLGGKVAVIDTETGSASLYTHLLDFDVLELTAPYTPEKYVEAIHAAEAAGYDIIVIDSLTHEWNGKGGCLELVDELAAAKFRGNSWAAFNVVTPRHRAFVDAMLQSPCHIIGTMRSKTETAQTEKDGRKQVIKLGMKSEQRDGIEYEFTVVLDIVHDGHFANASKDRTGLFGDPKPITPKTGEMLLAWLESGVEVVDEGETLFNIAMEGMDALTTMDMLQTWWKGNATVLKSTLNAERFGILERRKDKIKSELTPPPPAPETETTGETVNA